MPLFAAPRHYSPWLKRWCSMPPMRIVVIVGSTCFLAGLGLGVLVPTLLTPAPEEKPIPLTAKTEPAAAPDAFSQTEFPDRPPEPLHEIPIAPEVANPERDLARMNQPPEGGRPPWWDDREGQGPPPEIRTNREAMMAWMAERRLERAQQLRSNFVAKAELKDEEAVRFDVLMAALNMRLKEQSAKWREAMDSGAMTRSEVRARAMSEISQAMVITYDELDRNMPAGWREQAGEDFNLMTFVEPDVWRELRPVMRGGFRGGGGDRPPGREGEPPPQR